MKLNATASLAAAVTFLPPLASGDDAVGPFDTQASPAVVVCRLPSTEDGMSACADTVAHFTLTGAERQSRLRFDADDAQFIANWRTPTVAGRYRVTVYAEAEGRERGAIVVHLGDEPREWDDVSSPHFRAGRTLPIKFRLALLPAVPTWHCVAAGPTGGGLVSFAHVPAHDAIFASHGGDGAPMTLWRFDLAAAQWSPIPTSSSPSGQVRRIVHDPVQHEILTYAEGPGPVYAVAEAGGAWRELAPQDAPSAYNVPTVFWHPAAGRLAFFGGYGFGMWSNALWAYDRAGASWATLEQSAVRPMPRFAASHGIDEAAGALYLAGGQGHPTGNQQVGLVIPSDLWRLDFATNMWTELLPDDASRPAAYASALEVVPADDALYRFGGMAPPVVTRNGNLYEARPDVATAHNRIERLDLRSVAAGWLPVTTEGIAPSARWESGLFLDATRHRLVVVGGYTPQGSMLDVHVLHLR